MRLHLDSIATPTPVVVFNSGSTRSSAFAPTRSANHIVVPSQDEGRHRPGDLLHYEQTPVSGFRRLLPRRLTRRVRRTVNWVGGPLPAMYWNGLRRSGWVRSARLGAAVDRNGQPLPWYTYGAIDFLNERVPSSARVFEYGAGQSTRWYAQRVGEVVSVETNGEWATRIAGHGLPNVRILHRPEVDSYVTEVERNEGPFDIIVIDGVERLRCAEAAVSQLTPSGILVWDNSDEAVFQTAREQIAEVRALREVRFTGFGPCCTWTWSTSILYRPGNCLGL